MLDPVLEAVLRSWPFEPWLTVSLLLTAGVYLRGWLRLRKRGAARFGCAQLAAFLGGLAAIFVALASPIEPLSFLLLQVHMVQHLLLMLTAPALIWLGAPYLPLLHGLPRSIRLHWVAPWLRLPILQRAWQRLTHPLTAWLLFAAITWGWHAPALYALSLRSDGWHYAQHACFLLGGLLFWQPVIQPYPGQPHISRWLLVPYLMLADLTNTALSALLTFSSDVLYPHYAEVPRLWGVSALDDQAAAGVLMWVPGSLVYLVPLVWIGAKLLYGEEKPAAPLKAERGRIALPMIQTMPHAASSRPFDVLQLPLLGRFLKWRHARLTVQLPMFLLAGLIVWDGLTGPQVSPMNLAGVAPWIHWRGLVVLGLLFIGNVFCFACPFVLPRAVARRIWSPRWHWPRPLRSKWLAVLLLLIFFWAYEVFALWSSPWWTAWIALGYFLAALTVDTLFRGSAFCKYVCPIGQFNYVQSLMSPLAVAVRDPHVCSSCSTKDCIQASRSSSSRSGEPSRTSAIGDGLSLQSRGAARLAAPAGRSGEPSRTSAIGDGLSLQSRGAARLAAPTPSGCAMGLFLPRKAGNFDCTLCLDCVHACPHDNISLTAVMPGRELWRDRPRAGVGRFARRPDLAALVLLLVFAAFANAAGMVGPVLDVQDRLTAAWRLSSPLWMTTLLLVLALVVLPLLLVGAVSAVSRWWSDEVGRWLESACRFTFALAPLGFGMWLSHYCFHFFTSAEAIVPAGQRFLADLGLHGTPAWACDCCVTAAAWLLRLEILFLDAGLVLSLYSVWRIARERRATLPALKAFAPWAALLCVLFAVGVWILFQPMEMRGMTEVAR